MINTPSCNISCIGSLHWSVSAAMKESDTGTRYVPSSSGSGLMFRARATLRGDRGKVEVQVAGGDGEVVPEVQGLRRCQGIRPEEYPRR